MSDQFITKLILMDYNLRIIGLAIWAIAVIFRIAYIIFTSRRK